MQVVSQVNGASQKFRNLIAERQSHQVTVAPSFDLDEELDRYLAELTINKVTLDSNPLEWWKVHQYQFPTLALAAREALALQATSVQSERLFSKIGLLYQNKLRNRLSGESAERSALIACADMSDIARKLSCEKIRSVSLRQEGEELKEDEIDGEDDEEEKEEEEEEEEMGEREDNGDDFDDQSNGMDDGTDYGEDLYSNDSPNIGTPDSGEHESDPDDFFHSL